MKLPKDTHIIIAINSKQRNITQNRYEVLSDSDENDTKGCNNDNDELSNNVTASISSRQVNLGRRMMWNCILRPHLKTSPSVS